MKQLFNCGIVWLNKHRRIVLIVCLSVLAALLCVLFAVGMLQNRSKDSESDVPAGYVRVFRHSAHYKITETGERILYYSAEYDECGRELHEVYYDEAGSPSDTIDYAYDASGRLIRREKQVRMDNGVIRTELQLCEYDARDNLVDSTDSTTCSDGSYRWSERYYYTYNDSGVLVKRTKQCIYQDDSYTEETLYYPNGKIKEHLGKYVHCLYDEKGNLLIKKALETQKIAEVYSYAYNENGLCTKQIKYMIGDGTVTTEWAYDALDRTTKKTIDRDGKVTQTEKWVYDLNDGYTHKVFLGENIPYREYVVTSDAECDFSYEYLFTDAGERWLYSSSVNRKDDTRRQGQYYDEDGNLSTEYLIEKDEKGRVTKEISKSGSTYIIWDEYEYKTLPSSVEWTREISRDPNGAWARWWETEYLPDGTKISFKRFNEDGLLKENENGYSGYYYELDENNCPVREMDIIHGTGVLVGEDEYITLVIPVSAEKEWQEKQEKLREAADYRG